ncbi:hypothetical protein WK43_22940 [Burkholderia ubonensis]|nr:hypothetical protein WK23_04425 [Burkholderia vietnamiensis]KVS41442.1 hypothetical protein WK37_19950 [Burkholderia ubonensis]KVS53829.1 hypothetical protein WK38_07885 [Burkholderia ubonensis]KVS69980.1 hypothetical protein WK42_28680 [Burkholderia ubonensis]KVS85022.1 hypothetical protein WK43_22940 [Burkholderia ubonensis]
MSEEFSDGHVIHFVDLLFGQSRHRQDGRGIGEHQQAAASIRWYALLILRECQFCERQSVTDLIPRDVHAMSAYQGMPCYSPRETLFEKSLCRRTYVLGV